MVRKKKRNNWFSKLSMWQKVLLTLVTAVVTSLFVFYLYDWLGGFIENPLTGMLVTGSIIVVIGIFTSWKYVMNRTKRRL